MRWRANALSLCLAGLAAAGPAAALPGFSEVRAAHRPSDLTLLDRHGVPVQTLRMDDAVRRLEWVPLQAMSPALLQAIVLSEDKSFWQHSGVDWAAAARSAWANLWNARTRGASTVTMQLAGLIDLGGDPLLNEVTHHPEALGALDAQGGDVATELVDQLQYFLEGEAGRLAQLQEELHRFGCVGG